MIVRKTDNIDDIKKILCMPDIYRCIADDSCPSPDYFEPPIENHLYIGGYVDNDIMALMVFHEVEEKTKCHIQVLPKFRAEYAKEFARIALKFGSANNAFIYAEIPECYPNVIKFANSFGFKHVGNIKENTLKNGVLCDSIILRLDNELC